MALAHSSPMPAGNSVAVRRPRAVPGWATAGFTLAWLVSPGCWGKPIRAIQGDLSHIP